MREMRFTRRGFLSVSAKTAAAAVLGMTGCSRHNGVVFSGGHSMRFGLVTYLWGRDWDLPTLIGNCQNCGVHGVELRTEHAHRVESNLSKGERRQVRARFADSGVELVGLGTNFAFHYADKERLERDMEGAKAYVKLSYDVGGRGVKVKPNALPAGVAAERTIEQIGGSLNELGRYAADFGQEIRVEVHGKQTQELVVMRRIFDWVEQENVRVCWNCNPEDLMGEGLEYNFALVREDFGQTVHVRELDDPEYPYQRLMDLLVGSGYRGWVLLEARTEPADRVAALREQVILFNEMTAKARK